MVIENLIGLVQGLVWRFGTAVMCVTMHITH
jgi:hypothetical protein